MSLRPIRPSFSLLALATLLCTTHPSPAPVTVLPATPRPAPKPKPGSGFVGVWRGTTTGGARDQNGAQTSTYTQRIELTIQPDMTILFRGLGGNGSLTSGTSFPIPATTPELMAKAPKMVGRLSGSTLRFESTTQLAGNPYRAEVIITLTPASGGGKLRFEEEVSTTDTKTGIVSSRSTETATLERAK